MRKIVRGPGSGKTKEIMNYCAQEGAAFVCKNPDAMRVKAHAYGYKIEILSYLDFLQTPEYNQYNAYLDDIEEYLEYVGCHIKGFGGNE